MGWIECFVIALGLSMDAFAVAFSKGMTQRTFRLRQGLITGLWFGAFQAGMPLLGYFLGTRFAKYVERFDHWIAFLLLVFIGINMIREARAEETECEIVDDSFTCKRMLPLAVATSIDAFAIGLTFAFLGVNIWGAAGLIGVTTFVLSVVAVRIGTVFGEKFASHAEIAGGILLILMGSRILLNSLGIWG